MSDLEPGLLPDEQRQNDTGWDPEEEPYTAQAMRDLLTDMTAEEIIALQERAEARTKDLEVLDGLTAMEVAATLYGDEFLE